MRRLLIFLTVLLAAPAAHAQMACGDRAALLKAFGDKYGETPRALALSSSVKAVFEVYTSRKTGTWTIVMTTTKGVTCIMAAGHSWEEVAVDEIRT